MVMVAETTPMNSHSMKPSAKIRMRMVEAITVTPSLLMSRNGRIRTKMDLVTTVQASGVMHFR